MICECCKNSADQHAPVGPINVKIVDPEFVGPKGIKLTFCCWRCAAHWFVTAAADATD